MSPETQQIRNPEAEVLDRLKEHGLLEINELEVRVRQGVTFIEGAVPNLKQKKLAGEIASQVEGIREVINMLRITPLPVIDDKSLRKHIVRVLNRNPRKATVTRMRARRNRKPRKHKKVRRYFLTR